MHTHHRTNKKEDRICNKLLCLISIIGLVTAMICMVYFYGRNTISPAKNWLQILDHDTATTADKRTKKRSKTRPSKYYNSKGSDDLIDSMPNLLESTCSSSPTNCKFKQYSGYLLANDNREIHYWFIQSERTPHKKPVFIWTNGGPGCSGMDGLLTEHGPWKAQKDGYISYNQYSWINEVNMVYLEQPYGVGFSTVNDDQNVVSGDQNAADDMDAAIRDFINKFPSFARNTFYLSSESWGGHYVPMTTYTILQNNDNGVTPYINFGGFLLGNPYTDPYENSYGFVGDIYGHGMLKSTDWNQWRDNCWDNVQNMDNLELCAAIYSSAYYDVSTANVYALDYPTCHAEDAASSFIKASNLHHRASKFMQKVLNSNDYDALNMGHITRADLQELYDSKNNEERVHDTSSYEPCVEDYMSEYLNVEEVQEALHVKPTAWSLCSGEVQSAWPDSDYDSFMQPYYTNIVLNYVDPLGLTLAVYSGDDDSVCALEGTTYWLDRWGFDVNDEVEWEAWKDEEQQLAGYYTQYMQDNGHVALHFITIRSAGHMVPTTQPQRALLLLTKYLDSFVV